MIKIFADDVKMIVNPFNLERTKMDLEELQAWESLWVLNFNVEKCKVLHIGKSNPVNPYTFLNSDLSTCETEKDLGILFNNRLNFQDHIRAAI